jgi:hypothetical protein
LLTNDQLVKMGGKIDNIRKKKGRLTWKSADPAKY